MDRNANTSFKNLYMKDKMTFAIHNIAVLKTGFILRHNLCCLEQAICSTLDR